MEVGYFLKATILYFCLTTLTNFVFVIPTLLTVSTEQLAMYAQVLICCQIIGVLVTPGIVEVNLEKKLILQRRKSIRRTYLNELLAIRFIFLGITGGILITVIPDPTLVAAVCVTTFIMLAYNDFQEMMVILQLNQVGLIISSIGAVSTAILITLGSSYLTENPLFLSLGAVAFSQMLVVFAFIYYTGYKPVLTNLTILTSWNKRYFRLGFFQIINRNIDRIAIYGLSGDETIANYQVAQRFKSFFLTGQNIVSRLYQQELAGLEPDSKKVSRHAFLLMCIPIVLTYIVWGHADQYLLNYLGPERQESFILILLWGIYCSLLFLNNILSKIFISKGLVGLNIRIHYSVQWMNLLGVSCIFLKDISWYICYLISVQILIGIFRYVYINGFKENVAS